MTISGYSQYPYASPYQSAHSPYGGNSGYGGGFGSGVGPGIGDSFGYSGFGSGVGNSFNYGGFGGGYGGFGGGMSSIMMVLGTFFTELTQMFRMIMQLFSGGMQSGGLGGGSGSGSSIPPPVTGSSGSGSSSPPPVGGGSGNGCSGATATSSSGSGGNAPSNGSTGTTPVGTPTNGGANGIMDLSPFLLQLPTGQNGNTDSVPGSKLKNYNSPYFQYNGSKMTFHAPVTGVHNAGSNYPRSELGQNQGWKLSSGAHSLSATTSIDEAPPNKDIVIGQLHEKSSGGGGKPRPPIELHWTNGKIVASVLDSDTPNAGRTDHVIANNVPMGQKFSYNMQVSPDGQVKITADGKSQMVKLDSSFDSRDLYFKAGAYVQDNQGSPDEGGTVSFYALNMT